MAGNELEPAVEATGESVDNAADGAPGGEETDTRPGTDETPAPQQEIAYVPEADPIGDYLDAIDRAESLSSAYSTELSDLYLGLGQSHVSRGEFEEARKAFLRGMQVLRVNYGLNSPEQTSFLFPIADIEVMRGELREADKVLQTIYRINSRSLGRDHPDMLPVLNRLIGWYEERHRQLPMEQRYANMVKVERLTARMAGIIEKDRGLSHPDTATIYWKVGQMHYFMAAHLNRFGYSPNSSFAFGSNSNRGIPPSIRDHYSMGRDAFTKYADSMRLDEGRSPEEQASAIAQLADWHMIFDRVQSAGATYKEAYHVLSEGIEEGQSMETYFGAPKPLRFMKNELLSEEPPMEVTEGEESLEVSMTVTKSGKLRNIEILNPPEDMEQEDLKDAHRTLAGYRFRPRIVDGLPQPTESFTWHFPLVREGASP
ncbi:MAG: hypothetical protein GWM87_04110 [Xanthomonadales bacterium]|nr:hypothetical protein [Xanthomonadales bacterium]NIX12210.1 hypothetical protein [Xanthomonadales bacterium]